MEGFSKALDQITKPVFALREEPLLEYPVKNEKEDVHWVDDSYHPVHLVKNQSQVLAEEYYGENWTHAVEIDSDLPGLAQDELIPIMSNQGEEILVHASRVIPTCFRTEIDTSNRDVSPELAMPDPIDIGLLPEHLKPLVTDMDEEITEQQISKLAGLVNEYADVFVGPDKKLGRTHLVKHDIDTGDAMPIKQRARRFSLFKEEVASQELNKQVKTGLAYESYSPWASPIVLVKNLTVPPDSALIIEN